MAIRIAISENTALIKLMESNPKVLEISIPPSEEPKAIPILKAEILSTEATSSVPAKYFSES